MKKLSFSLFLFLIVTPAFAQSGPLSLFEKEYSWGDKLKRGAINVITSLVEVAREIHMSSAESNLLYGWTIGLIHGVGEGLVRFGAGAIDILTCPFDFPKSHKGPLIQPEYVWQKPGPKYS